MDGSLRLVIADFSGGNEIQTLNQTQAKALFAKLNAFCENTFSGRLQDEIDESTPAHSLALLLQQQRNPPKQLITKVDLAKYENAWRFLPNIVSQGAQKNFMVFSNYIQGD